MLRRWSILLAMLALTAGTALAATGASAATTNARGWTPGGPVHLVGPRAHARGIGNQAESTNWSGYAATTGTYTSVSASWTQPAGICSRGDQYAAFWVGLDGYGSSSVEQTGSEVDCVGRTAEYYAWYEMYPAASKNYSNPVKAGDQFTATVTYQGDNEFSLYIDDITQKWSHTTTASLASAARSSAEVIVEAPCCTFGGGILPLTDFGTMSFTGSTANGSAIGSAAGVTEIVMVDNAGRDKDSISSLSNGESFSATWLRSSQVAPVTPPRGRTAPSAGLPVCRFTCLPLGGITVEHGLRTVGHGRSGLAGRAWPVGTGRSGPPRGFLAWMIRGIRGSRPEVRQLGVTSLAAQQAGDPDDSEPRRRLRWRRPRWSQLRPPRHRWLWAAGAAAVSGAVIVALVISLSPGRPRAAGPDPSPRPTAAASAATATVGNLLVVQMRPGDCLTGANMALNTNNPWPKLTSAVPCSQPHTAEVFFADNAFWPKHGSYPGDSTISKDGNAACNSAFQSYVGIAYAKSMYTWANIIPDATTWPAGDRALHCIAYYVTPGQPAGAKLTGSIRRARK